MINQFIQTCQKKINKYSADFTLIDEILPAFQEFLKQSEHWLDHSKLQYNAKGFMRNILHSEEDIGLFVVTWNALQCSPIHDHNKTWGLMGVLKGQLYEEEYSMTPTTVDAIKNEQYQLTKKKLSCLKAGAVTAFLSTPNRYIHRMGNPYETPALSLHLYGSALNTYYLYSEKTGEKTEFSTA